MLKVSAHLKPTLLAAAMVTGCATLALAQPAPNGNPAPVKGEVAQYILTPAGAVDGMILTDGTEVHTPPAASTRLVFSVRPGDKVTIRGTRTIANPVVNAIAVTNDATGVIIDLGPPGPARRIDDASRVKLQLHGSDGRFNGVQLEDGTIVRLPPPDADRHAAALAVGQPLYASGDGVYGPLGKVIAAREIGPNQTDLVKIDAPGFDRWMHEVFGGSDTPAAPPPVAPRS